MIDLLYALLATARSSLKPQRELALENLALRQQLAILSRKTKRPKLTKTDRVFWVALCGLWPEWQRALILVKPETVIGWHRKGFKVGEATVSRYMPFRRKPPSQNWRTFLRNHTQGPRFDRLLCRADGHVSPSLRVPRARA